MKDIVEHAYGVATGDLFLIATPFAFLGLLAVLFIREKPLKTTSGMERLAAEGTPSSEVPAPRDEAGHSPETAAAAGPSGAEKD